MFKKVLLTQFCIPSLDTLEFKSNVHLAPGYLAAYARDLCPDTTFIITPRVYTDILSSAAFVEFAVAQKPDLLVFSLYLWNIEKSLKLAGVLKQRIPGVTILFGGPEVNPDNDFLLDSDIFNEGIAGEGEVSFVDYILGKPKKSIGGLLTKVGYNDFSNLRGSYSADKNPYIAGMMEENLDCTMFFETVRGCPFSCNFCYYNKVYDKIVQIGKESLSTFIDYADAHGVTELFLLDPSFNVQPGFDEILDLLIDLNSDKRFTIATELRADFLTDSQINKLSQLNLIEAEIGLQSTNPQALEAMGKRDSSKKTIERTQAMSKAGISCKVDLIVGLPGDTLDSFKKSVDEVYASDIYDNVQVFRLSILPGTEYAINRQKYGIVADRKPPYYIESTPTFSSTDIIEASEYAEELFEVSLYPVTPFLLCTDFTDIEVGEYIHFKSEITPIHKIVFDKYDCDLSRYRQQFCETLIIHFIVSELESQPGLIENALAFFSNEFPDNYYQVILEFRCEACPELVQTVQQAMPQNRDSYLNKDAIAHIGVDLCLSSRLAVVAPYQARLTDNIQELNDQYNLFLAVDRLDEALIEDCYEADFNLYFTGPYQNEIYQFLEQNESLDDFTIFDSFKIEKRKQDKDGKVSCHFPHIFTV